MPLRDLLKRYVEDFRWWLIPNELLALLFTLEHRVGQLMDRMDRVEAVTGEMATGDSILVQRDRA